MIKCNVSVCGTVSKAAVVRNGKDGMPFTTYSVDVVNGIPSFPLRTTAALLTECRLLHIP